MCTNSATVSVFRRLPTPTPGTRSGPGQSSSRMILILKHPVVVDEVSLVQQFVVPDMVVVVMIGITGPMWRMEHWLCSPSLFASQLVCLSLAVAKDEAIQNVNFLSIPIPFRPKVLKGCNSFKESPNEEEDADDRMRQPVHLSECTTRESARDSYN